MYVYVQNKYTKVLIRYYPTLLLYRPKTTTTTGIVKITETIILKKKLLIKTKE